jgi:hypothetical protein
MIFARPHAGIELPPALEARAVERRIPLGGLLL